MIAVRMSSMLGSFGASGIASVTMKDEIVAAFCSPYFATRSLRMSHSAAVQISPSEWTSGPPRS